MKTITRLLIAAAICTSLIGSDASAAERGRKEYNTGNSKPAQQHPQQRPGNNGQPSHGKPNQGGINNRPGNNHNPDNGNNHRPGNGNNKPGNGNDHGYRPSGNTGHGHNYPSHTPSRPPQPNFGHNHHHPAPRPPHRPHIPNGWGHWRPTPPPPSYRPYVSWPRFSTVLGVRFGTSLALTLNALLNSGYSVVGNYNNMVYLQNVPMLGVYWPEATLSYTGSGRLAGSEFINYSTWADFSLYNRLYGLLCGTYGSPYNNSGTSAAWWGPDGQYIRLNFASGIGADGRSRYYTTLNFGIY
ncbi:MAG: hypothetical protein K2M06_02245 [Muribaculaceae bacterium]|nr:hypothetical protein [Muribaculaceae bacterium]